MGSLQEKMKLMPSMKIQAGEPFLVDIMHKGINLGTVKFDITRIKTTFKGISDTEIEFRSTLVKR